MAPGQLPADAPRGVLEEVADGDAVCHLVLGRPIRDGDLLAVQTPTDDGAVWLPVRYVTHSTHGVDRLPLLHPSWRVAIATVHGPADVAIDLPATAIMRWLVSARRLRPDETNQLRETADEIEECSAALRRAMQDPASGVGELGRRLLALEAGVSLEAGRLRELANEMKPPRTSDVAQLEVVAQRLEQEVGWFRRYAGAGALSQEARTALAENGGRLLLCAGWLRELAAALQRP